MMGQSESSFKRSYSETVCKLSSVQLGEIASRFNELYARAGGPKGHLVDREAFSQYFKLPATVGDRLFDAFDEQKNGKISFEEFVCGLALVLHGSLADKFQLLFRMFNIRGDEGVSREELTTMLTAILQSTNTILHTVAQEDTALMHGEDTEQAVRRMVSAAFDNCDITRTGKLLPLEFEYWLKRNPKILDTLLAFHTKQNVSMLGPIVLEESPQLSTKPDTSDILQPSTKPVTSDVLQPSTKPVQPVTSDVLQLSTKPDTSDILQPSTKPVTSDVLQPSTKPVQPVTSDVLQPSTKPVQPITSDVLQPSTKPVTSDVLQPSTKPVTSDVLQPSTKPVQPVTSDVLQPSTQSVQPVTPDVLQPSTKPVQPVTSDVLQPSTKPVISDVLQPSTKPVQPDTSDVLQPSTKPVQPVTSDVLQPSTKPVQPVTSDVLQPSTTPVQPVTSDVLQPSTFDISVGGPDVVVAFPPQPSDRFLVAAAEPTEEGVLVHQSTQVTTVASDQEGHTSEEIMRAFVSSPAEEADGGGSIMVGEDASEPPPQLPELIELAGVTSQVPSSPVLPTTMETIATLEEKEEEEEGDREEEEEEEGSISEMSEQEPLEEANFATEPLPDMTTALSPQVSVESERDLPSLDTGTVRTALMGTADTPPADADHQPLKEGEREGPHPPLAPDHQALKEGDGEGPHPPLPADHQAVSEGEPVKESLYSAWPLSGWLESVLCQGPTMAAPSLTCPGLVAAVQGTDPVGDLLATHFPGTGRAPQLSVEQVSMDTEGLSKLVRSGCLNSALELTGRFLSAHGQGIGQAGQPTTHTHKTLQMWSARIALLMHLQRFREAELELTAFGELDSPDLFYQYHPHNYPGMKGSMVPFSLRLLHAQLPSYTGNPRLALDRLCTLQWNSEQVLSGIRRWTLPSLNEVLSYRDQEVAQSIWEGRLHRVLFAIGNCLATMQDYHLAAQVYQGLVDKLPALRLELLSGIGRLFLQMGDLPTALTYFSQVSQSTPADSVLDKVDDALVHVFFSRWQKAGDCFAEALQLQPGNLVVLNNIAVCTFFQGKLKEAVGKLELLVRSCPPASLQAAFLLNLSAAYDLESGNSTTKKLSILPLIGQFAGEGFYLNALNLH